MKMLLSKFFLGSLLVISLGLFYLSNVGALFFRKPYIYHLIFAQPQHNSIR
jgi:hypothetical protein